MIIATRLAALFRRSSAKMLMRPLASLCQGCLFSFHNLSLKRSYHDHVMFKSYAFQQLEVVFSTPLIKFPSIFPRLILLQFYQREFFSFWKFSWIQASISWRIQQQRWFPEWKVSETRWHMSSDDCTFCDYVKTFSLKSPSRNFHKLSGLSPDHKIKN